MPTFEEALAEDTREIAALKRAFNVLRSSRVKKYSEAGIVLPLESIIAIEFWQSLAQDILQQEDAGELCAELIGEAIVMRAREFVLHGSFIEPKPSPLGRLREMSVLVWFARCD